MSENTGEVVLYSVRERIARITLNRPARKNAINAAVHVGLRQALDQIENDSRIRVLLITGAGDAFCAGQDLTERAGMLAEGEVDLARSLHEHYNPLIRRLAALRMPVIAAVNGVAAGAGAALAMVTDIVLAARSARFQLAFARVALGPDSGVSWMLPRMIGQARALGMALTADMIEAERAESWGLIWRTVDDDALTSEAEALAHHLAAGPRTALQAIKRRLRNAAAETLDEALDAERDAQGVLGKHASYREAVQAFIAKRVPTFD